MLNPHELRMLEIEAERAKLQATCTEARSHLARLDNERAMLAPQLGSTPAVRSGLGFAVVVLAIALAAALVGAVTDAPGHAAATTATGAVP